ncbi:MAG: sigma-70 family RNA polymerase sigma factor [Planctomycetota bacterium]
METSDREIIRRVLGGEHERFHELVQRHAGPLWGTLTASLADREEAREILQETWVRAFEGLSSLRDPDRLRSWLVSIALNLVRQLGRRPRLASLDGGGEGPGGEPLPAPEPADGPEERETLAAVRAEMERLPRRQREVLDLRLNHELSHREIAHALGITEESSRANAYQALRRLRQRFADQP